MSLEKFGGIALAVAAVAAIVIYWTARDSTQPSASTSVQLFEVGTRADGAPSPQPVKRFDLPPLRSFAGVDVDGDIRLDAQGRVIATRELRRLFDFFLSATGEIDRKEITATLRRYLAQRDLPAKAIAEAMGVFDRYLNYKAAFADQVAINRADPDAMRQALRVRAELRRSMLGVAIADAFFRDEEIVDQYTVDRIAIMRNRNLSDAERERQLALLRQTLPTDAAAREEEQLRIGRLSQDTEALRAAGASEDAIRQLRTERVGAEAATRLEQLDRERDQWQQRLDDFRRARADVLSQPGLSSEQQQAAIDDLIRARFSPTEALRLSALDEIERTKRKPK